MVWHYVRQQKNCRYAAPRVLITSVVSRRMITILRFGLIGDLGHVLRCSSMFHHVQGRLGDGFGDTVSPSRTPRISSVGRWHAGNKKAPQPQFEAGESRFHALCAWWIRAMS